MADIERALEKFVKGCGVDFRTNSVSYIFTCPRCQQTKLAMYRITGRFRCHKCHASGFQGKPEWALTELTGQPVAEIRKAIYGDDLGYMPGLLEIELEDKWFEDEEGQIAIELPTPLTEVQFPLDFITLDKPMAFVKGARYLHSRGVTAEHVNTYDIHYSPVERRVVFPVKVDGKLIGWQARYTGPTKVWNEAKGKYYNIPKVLTSDSLKGMGGRYLMFQDRLKASKHCVLSEGPITAIKAHRCGGNVASMGKAVTQHHLETISKYVKKLYIALDPDAGAEIAKLAYDMYNDLEIYLLQPPQNYLNLDAPENDKDLGDFSEDEVYELFMAAKPEPRGRLYISLGSVLVW